MADAEKSEAAVEEVANLIQRATELGFNFVDMYGEGDELIAFTCSSSWEYIDAIQNIEMKKRNN